MQQPPFLKQGNTIGIAATARKISEAEIAPAVRIFESWGLRVKLSSTLYCTDHQFAGNDGERAKGFQELLDDEQVNAIICARGGYGTVRMIDTLDFSHFLKKPKWIVGYSDITVLHAHIHQHAGVQTLHATMPVNMQPEKADAESMLTLKEALFGAKQLQRYTDPHALNRTGSATGMLTGGNLSVIYSLLGSRSDANTDGKILFLEDLDEYVYHIDRMMMNLKRNGKLERLAGLVVGHMSDMKDNLIPFGKTAEEIIRQHVDEFGFPVCFGFSAGHEKRNLALRFGAQATLKIDAAGAMLNIA